ncbi:unnamed protein product [Caenorhabditis auriculariae]|uniref:C2H2-type domain-containing protein n=1 Tax=Caenorhabditis auriculariae TaxID=2777116 RepID=A0A8S1GWH4_9PELO|nr:unnamed protein product [Caenorhabditis auriculariae]
MDTSTGLTCVTCAVAFNSADLQRDHYKSEWHRYNLKRMAAELPPISSEQFTVKAQSYSTEPSKREVKLLYCAVCKKQLKSQNAMNDHLASKKHAECEKSVKKGPKQPKKQGNRQKAPKTSEPENEDVSMKSEDEDEDDDDSSSGWKTDNGTDDEQEIDFNEQEALPVTSCLFCHQTKPSISEIKQHMNFHHGFQVPDQTYLVDEPGLLKYLGLKVGAGRCCIFCPDVRARFAAVESCQRHMRDKEHCKLRRDPESMIELSDFYDYSSMYEKEDDASNDVLYDDGWSLALPSGGRIGHRSLMRYYKQYLKPVNGEQRQVGQAAIDKVRGLFPALAYTGTTGTIAKQAAKDLKFVEKFRRRFDLRVGMKSNKLFKSQGRYGDN